MPSPPAADFKGGRGSSELKKPPGKLGFVSGVYVPVCLNILSILMFLRFGVIIGRVGLVGFFGLLVIAYCVDLLTTLSLSAIASNGEVKGGGAYYLISRSLGPEFGGSIGILFYLAQVLNSAMNIVGLVDCIRLFVGPSFPQGYWTGYALQTAALIFITCMCFFGSTIFARASSVSLAIISIAVLSIPISAVFQSPFENEALGITFTGISLTTLRENLLPHTGGNLYHGFQTFRDLFGILFPATCGIFAGASMSGDLKNPSKSIPRGTLWAMLTTFVVYIVVVLSLAASTTHSSLIASASIVSDTSLFAPLILAGECSLTVFSALIGIVGSSKLFQALAKDELLPGLTVFGTNIKLNNSPLAAILLTYAITQVALLADLNQIATFISMGFQMTFFVMNLACFLLKIGSAPNFRPSFKFFTWQTAFLGSLLSAVAMFVIEETYAGMAICVLVIIFLLIHYLCPPKRWGDVSQNLIYHQVRKYLLRLRPEHIKFWRPHIILLVNNPRQQTRLIQFCNSMKKGSLYILGHVIVTDDFNSGVEEARLQQQAWTNYISEVSRIKAFVQLTMSPSITWGIRNLILSAGLGGMRPNIAIVGFYNMEELRKSNPSYAVPDIPTTPQKMMYRHPKAGKRPTRRRGDTSARLLEGFLPTDVIRTEGMMSPTEYMTMLEDLTLKYRLNVAVGYGFDKLETPRKLGRSSKKHIDLWPIQMSAEVSSDGKNLLTTNFDTYTLILQLGHILHSVRTWRQAYVLRVMVFVEYENEVEEETSRVKALLEKLRIEAEVKVFWLASGQLKTYELIINGRSSDMDWEIIVNEALKDAEWWDDLQMFRQEDAMSSSEEIKHLAHIIDSTVGRPGAYNPHGESSSDAHRRSLSGLPEISRQPAIADLAKMGVNMGIHTQHLDDAVFREDDAGDFEHHAEGSSDEEDEDVALGQVVSNEAGDRVQEPLLSGAVRQRSSGHVKSGKSPKSRSRKPSATQPPTYGTISSHATPSNRASRTSLLHNDSYVGSSTALTPQTPSGTHGDHRRMLSADTFPFLTTPDESLLQPLRRSRSTSPKKQSGTKTPRDGATTPSRPGMSRQSSAARFSSRPVPETTITSEAEGSKLSFAATPSRPGTPKADRPTFSRQSSHGKFSSQPIPETHTAGNEGSRTISFAERPVFHPPQSHSGYHSRQESTFSQGDVSLSIPELLESYKLDSATDPTGGSSYSTQNLSLSFNDLPSRAQHLILNELMRQHSSDTSVLLSTLPIPVEGSSLDELATVQYLSDVEVLCNELPPVLMVLSNNMTVTVSL